jgi:phage tail sheath protein FI
MRTLRHPGVYQDEQLLSPPPVFRTGVTAFLADLPGPGERLRPISRFSQFLNLTGGSGGTFLQAAVRGYFENGGEVCYLVPASFPEAFAALDATDADLVCWPELMCHPEEAVQKQQMLLDYCDRNEEIMMILDPLPGGTIEGAVDQWRILHGVNGALYYPWVRVRSGPPGVLLAIPPCGHVAGVYARVDRETGVFRAPANVDLEGVHDLQTTLTDTNQDEGNPHNVVNCLRAFPGRGIRVWGARTISRQINWRYVSVRRLLITLRRWVNTTMADVAFEPSGRLLWARIRRQLNTFLESLFRAGALKGSSPAEAFFVRCDAANNTAADRDAGRVVVEIGLAPAVPAEFIVARLVIGQTGKVEESNQKEQ